MVKYPIIEQFSGDNKWKYVFKLNASKLVKKSLKYFSLLIQLLGFREWITAVFPYFSERPTWPSISMHYLLGYLALAIGVGGKEYKPSSSK